MWWNSVDDQSASRTHNDEYTHGMNAGMLLHRGKTFQVDVGPYDGDTCVASAWLDPGDRGIVLSSVSIVGGQMQYHTYSNDNLYASIDQSSWSGVMGLWYKLIVHDFL